MVVSKVRIKKDAETVWQALTDPAQMKEWYFDIPDFVATPGNEFSFYEPGEERKYLHQCIVQEVIPGKLLSYTWVNPDYSKGITLVTWKLAEEDGITTVRLEHEGIENLADAGPDFAPENYQAGWDGFLQMLNNYVKGLRKKTYSASIEASAEKIWDVLFNPETYSRWTAPFGEGSSYEGKLQTGERIRFFSNDESGMWAKISYCDKPNLIIFQHLGVLKDGEELPVNPDDDWTGAFESYTLKQKDKVTYLQVEVETTPEMAGYFDEHFPIALEKVKELASDK